MEIASSSELRSGTERLATYIKVKQRQGLPPFVLLLGAGASTASGYPDGAGFVKQFLQELDISVENVSDDQLRTKFDQEWLIAPPQVREALVKKILPQIPPSKGYGALATLIAWGAFDVILNLNPDDLLEQALVDRRFFLRDWSTLNARRDDYDWIATKLGSQDPRVKIVKLHGDLRSGQFAFSKEETARFRPKVKGLIQQQLLQDVISFGSRLADQDVRSCLETRTDNSLWFVSRSAPDDHVARLLKKRNSCLNQITGHEAEFDRFFPRLLAAYQGTSLEPQPWEAQFGDQTDHDLSRILCLTGPYGYGVEGMFLGAPRATAWLLIKDLSLTNCRVRVRLRIVEDGGDETNWVGCQLRAKSARYGDGFLVYLRANGDIDLYSKLPGFDGIIKTARRVASPRDWTELELRIHDNSIEVLAHGGEVMNLEDASIVAREGDVYLLGYRTKSYFSHVEVRPL